RRREIGGPHVSCLHSLRWMDDCCNAMFVPVFWVRFSCGVEVRVPTCSLSMQNRSVLRRSAPIRDITSSSSPILFIRMLGAASPTGQSLARGLGVAVFSGLFGARGKVVQNGGILVCSGLGLIPLVHFALRHAVQLNGL